MDAGTTSKSNIELRQRRSNIQFRRFGHSFAFVTPFPPFLGRLDPALLLVVEPSGGVWLPESSAVAEQV